MTKANLPLISICCITYNHDRFLRKAIDSFLSQVGDFNLEIIISDDNSTDNTQHIILEYLLRYPGKIKRLFSDRNTGVWINFRKVLMAAAGDFVAYCDGDDYYTSPHKLQLQLDALRSSPECSFCFHDTIIVADDETELSLFSNGRLTYNKPTQIFDSRQIIGAPLLAAHANSLFFYGEILQKHRKLFYDMSNYSGGDFTLLFVLCLEGNGIYLSKAMSAYRKHVNSVSNSRIISRSVLSEIKRTHDILKSYSGHTYDNLIDRNYWGHYVNLVNSNLYHAANSLSLIRLIRCSLLLPAVSFGSQYTLRDSLHLVRIAWLNFAKILFVRVKSLLVV